MKRFSHPLVSIFAILSFVLASTVFSGDLYSAEKKKTDAELIEDLKSSENDVVIVAARKLGENKTKDAVVPLITVLKNNPSPKVRIAAASGLGRMGTKGAPTTALAEAVQQDQDNSVVYASLLSILNLKDLENPAAIEALNFAEKNKADDREISDVVKRIRKATEKK